MLARFIKKNYFILILAVLFVITDLCIAARDPVNRLPVFYKNDLEKTRHFHPGKDWPEVFYGNSVVIASYIEEESSSGVINMGINYGKITDLHEILKGNAVNITGKIVLGLNMFTFMDNLPTDPAYLWHKKPYEPYIFFYRDHFKKYIVNNGEALLKGMPLNVISGSLYDKELYFGRLDDLELAKKMDAYDSLYGDLSLKDFEKNIKALKKVVRYCENENIRLKAIWMPWNKVYKPPGYVEQLKSEVNFIFDSKDIEVLDWTDRYEGEYFHDLGHLNREKGAKLFTKEIDEWLGK